MMHVFAKVKCIIHFKENLAMKKISVHWTEWSESYLPIKFYLKIYNIELNLSSYSKMSLGYLSSFKEKIYIFFSIKVIRKCIPNKSQS